MNIAPMTAPEKTFPPIGCLANSICLASAYGESSFIPLLGTFPTRNACGWFLAGALSGCVKMSPSKTTLRSLCLTTELPQLRCLRLSPPNPLRWASAGAPNRPPKKTFPPIGRLASSVSFVSASGENLLTPLLSSFPTANALLVCGGSPERMRGNAFFSEKNISPHPLRRRMGGSIIDWIKIVHWQGSSLS